MDCYGGQQSDDKQWGVADNGAAAQNWSKTITLPIAFSNPNYIVAGSATIIDGIYVLFTHSNKTTSSVLIFASGCWSGNTSRYANWFALGYQQWGVINAPAFPDDGQPVTFPVKFSKIPSVITAINQAKNSVSSTQLFTASINTYTTTSNMILHRYGGLTASDVRVDWFAWSV